MARNIAKRQSSDEPDAVEQEPVQKGGTPGIVAPQTRVSALPATMVAKAQTGERAVEPKQFEVMTTRDVMYEHQRTTLRQGRVVSEASCDVNALMRQGVQLREIPLERPAEHVPQDTAPVQVVADDIT